MRLRVLELELQLLDEPRCALGARPPRRRFGGEKAPRRGPKLIGGFKDASVNPQGRRAGPTKAAFRVVLPWTYRWAHDETQVTFRVLVDGQWRTLTNGRQGPGVAFYSPDGEIVARMVLAPGRRPTLVTAVDVLDRALADFRRANGEPAAAPTDEDHQPKLCPNPTPEPETTQSANSIASQEYVSGLPYGWAVRLGKLSAEQSEALARLPE